MSECVLIIITAAAKSSISVYCGVSSSSLYPQQPLLRAPRLNQVKSTFRGFNISLNQGLRDASVQMKATLACCSEENVLNSRL